MVEVQEAVRGWFTAGKRVVVATLVETVGSAPRDPGASFAVSDAGDVAGAISGGCVEATLVDMASDVLRDGTAREHTFGPDDLLEAGLTCGGTIRVIVAPLDPDVFAAFDSAPLCALAIRLTPPFQHAVVTPNDREGMLGNADLTAAVQSEARAMLATSATRIRSFGPDGQAVGNERVFIATFVARPRLYIVGATDFARPLTAVARVLGFESIVIDPRGAFAGAQRFPDADHVIVAWPDEVLAAAPIDERTAVVTLAHDPKFDLPTLALALRSPAGYVGAMGNRSTNERRLVALRELGLTDGELARLHAPIGLDLGSRTPEETAISIVAEIVAVRHGRRGGPLTGGHGNLRGRALIPA